MCVHVAICRHPILIFIPHIIRHAHIIYSHRRRAPTHWFLSISSSAPRCSHPQKRHAEPVFLVCVCVLLLCGPETTTRRASLYIYMRGYRGCMKIDTNYIVKPHLLCCVPRDLLFCGWVWSDMLYAHLHRSLVCKRLSHTHLLGSK